MKPSLKEQYNDVLRHLINSGAFLFRACHADSPECKEKWELWQAALKKAERMVEEISMAKYFRPEEFACKCGCGFDQMKPSFVEKLDFARGRAQVPFIINSGARCEQHNKDEGGKPESEHLANDDGLSEGVDISTKNSSVRWKVVTSAIAAGIRRIGIGDDFVHLGDGLSHKPHPVIWTY